MQRFPQLGLPRFALRQPPLRALLALGLGKCRRFEADDARLRLRQLHIDGIAAVLGLGEPLAQRAHAARRVGRRALRRRSQRVDLRLQPLDFKFAGAALVLLRALRLRLGLLLLLERRAHRRAELLERARRREVGAVRAVVGRRLAVGGVSLGAFAFGLLVARLAFRLLGARAQPRRRVLAHRRRLLQRLLAHCRRLRRPPRLLQLEL